MSRVEIRVTISSDQDIVVARQRGRSLALELGFSSGDATLIATAISELARNIVSYAGSGLIALKDVQGNTRVGITVTASDNGPGIPNVSQALRDGGLPGVRRLMDEFEIASEPGQGTRVVVKKWRP